MRGAGQSLLAAADWEEIRATAKAWQYDRFLAATLSPRNARSDLLVLAAFCGEIERICWTVSEPTIAAMRLQWWRDALLIQDSSKTGNPLADALGEVIERHDLSVGLLVGHIDTQDIELYSDLVDDIEALWVHFTKRDGAMINLSVRILGAKPDSALQDTIDHAARAYGMARTVAQLRQRSRARQLLLPGDHAVAHAIQPSEGKSIDPTAAKAILAILSSAALVELDAFRATSKSIQSSVFAAFLPLSLTNAYLHFASRQFDAANPSDMEPSPFSKARRMLMSYLRSRI